MLRYSLSPKEGLAPHISRVLSDEHSSSNVQNVVISSGNWSYRIHGGGLPAVPETGIPGDISNRKGTDMASVARHRYWTLLPILVLLFAQIPSGDEDESQPKKLTADRKETILSLFSATGSKRRLNSADLPLLAISRKTAEENRRVIAES